MHEGPGGALTKDDVVMDHHPMPAPRYIRESLLVTAMVSQRFNGNAWRWYAETRGPCGNYSAGTMPVEQGGTAAGALKDLGELIDWTYEGKTPFRAPIKRDTHIAAAPAL